MATGILVGATVLFALTVTVFEIRLRRHIDMSLWYGGAKPALFTELPADDIEGRRLQARGKELLALMFATGILAFISDTYL